MRCCCNHEVNSRVKLFMLRVINCTLHMFDCLLWEENLSVVKYLFPDDTWLVCEIINRKCLDQV